MAISLCCCEFVGVFCEVLANMTNWIRCVTPFVKMLEVFEYVLQKEITRKEAFTVKISNKLILHDRDIFKNPREITLSKQ